MKSAFRLVLAAFSLILICIPALAPAIGSPAAVSIVLKSEPGDPVLNRNIHGHFAVENLDRRTWTPMFS